MNSLLTIIAYPLAMQDFTLSFKTQERFTKTSGLGSQLWGPLKSAPERLPTGYRLTSSSIRLGPCRSSGAQKSQIHSSSPIKRLLLSSVGSKS